MQDATTLPRTTDAARAPLGAPDDPRRGVDESAHSLGFFFLVVLTAVLFIRPAEIFPALEGMPIYNVVILACILTSLPVLARQLTWTHLKAHPAVLCVLGLLPAIVLSQLAHGNTSLEGPVDFVKVLVFYLLLTGLVSTPVRLGKFIVATLVFIIAIAVIAELSYHGRLEVEGISAHQRSVGIDPDTGELVTVNQLYGPGIFNDPNDFSLILSAAVLILVHLAIQSSGWVARVGALSLAFIPGYAFALTNSRGGFLALATGLGVLGVGRFGLKRSLPFILVTLPVLLVLFGGRMTNINLDADDTAQGRMEIWREGMLMLKRTPIFGIGYGNYAEEVGHVAHNSYVHAFTELGLVGGVLFTAAIYIPLSVMRKLHPEAAAVLQPKTLLPRWRPALLAVIAGYAVGLCSLSRVYTVSTYLILGLGAAYCSLVKAEGLGAVQVLNWAYVRHLLKVGLGCLAFFYLFARFLQT